MARPNPDNLKSNNKVLVISGPTATGKTALAITISKIIPSELISADSRQVYVGLDIGVGKDHPVNTPIHGIDLIYPDQIYSVAEFQHYAFQKIAEIQSRGHLPIVVGCSGFYINSILKNNYHTFHIKPNYLLRFFLDRLPLKILQFTLRLLDFNTFDSLNNSDINNPRRLIRKIEIKLSSQNTPVVSKKGDGGRLDILHLSLTAPSSFLYPRIDARVEERLRIGHLEELKTLLKKYKWSDPGLKVSAYASFKNYDIPDAIKKWKYAEHHDALHQITFFKKLPSANFIDISQAKSVESALNLVKKWYNKP